MSVGDKFSRRIYFLDYTIHSEHDSHASFLLQVMLNCLRISKFSLQLRSVDDLRK